MKALFRPPGKLTEEIFCEVAPQHLQFSVRQNLLQPKTSALTRLRRRSNLARTMRERWLCAIASVVALMAHPPFHRAASLHCVTGAEVGHQARRVTVSTHLPEHRSPKRRAP
jgi:hypothetical protein